MLLQLGGDIKQGYARRMTLKFADRIELRTVVAHDGRSFIHHCETPNVPNAWANVGTDCITRGTTFHVMPPAVTPKSASAASPPADAANVVFFASKFEGTARPKRDVIAWLDDAVAQYLKPCLAGAASGSSWKVSFEVGKTGKAGASAVVGGEPEAPADASTAACIAKVVDAAKLEGSASDTVRVTAVFAIQ